MAVHTTGSSEDDWAERMRKPPRHHSRGALAGQVAAAFVLTAALLAVPLAIIRALL